MRERLLRLDVNVRELVRFRQMYSHEDVRRDPHLEWALRYRLLEAIQIVIDLSCHIVSARNLGVPATYAECVELLSRAGLLSSNVAKAGQEWLVYGIFWFTNTSLLNSNFCMICLIA